MYPDSVIEMLNIRVNESRKFTATLLAPRTSYQVSVSLRNQIGPASTTGSITITTFGLPCRLN